MIVFKNAENLLSRVAGLDTILEGEEFPFFVKMPCRFAIIRANRRHLGKKGDYIIFHSHNDLEIVTEKLVIQTEEIEVKNVKTENHEVNSGSAVSSSDSKHKNNTKRK